MAKEYKLTVIRMKELEEELQYLKTIREKEVAELIKEARSFGDLSENSEYEAAKEAQAMLEMKINKLKATLAEAKIIDTSRLAKDSVQILSTVEMENVRTGMKMKYTIVSESEADLRKGKISSQTPIAQGLLGKKVGETVSVTVPNGTMELKILNITFD